MCGESSFPPTENSLSSTAFKGTGIALEELEKEAGQCSLKEKKSASALAAKSNCLGEDERRSLSERRGFAEADLGAIPDPEH